MYLTLLGITVLTQSTFYSFVTYTFPSSTNKIFVSRCRNGHIQNIIRATILLSPDLQHTDEKIHWCLHNSEAIIIRPLFGFGPLFFHHSVGYILYNVCMYTYHEDNNTPWALFAVYFIHDYRWLLAYWMRFFDVIFTMHIHHNIMRPLLLLLLYSSFLYLPFIFIFIFCIAGLFVI